MSSGRTGRPWVCEGRPLGVVELIDVRTAQQELAIPPTVTVGHAKGFSLWATRSILSGNGAEVLGGGEDHLRRLAPE